MKKRVVVIFFGFIIFCGMSFVFYSNDFNKNKSFVSAEYIRKVDGDTAIFKIDNKNVKCRFLAIDTPETVKPNTPVQAYGKEASKFTDKMLSNAKDIYLEFDNKSDKYDKYNRMLVWVWCDDKLLQEELLKRGYAELKYIYDDYKYVDCLDEIQTQAKKDKIGIWEE